jgi:hypothetical protein
VSYRVESTPGASKKLRAKADGWSQATFVVPTGNVAAFAAALRSGAPPWERASLVVEGTSRPVYEIAALTGGGAETMPRDTTLEAVGAEAAAGLLAAALADYVDGWFVPKPGSMVVFVDNDEYATVFAPKQGAVSSRAEALRAAGFREAVGYERRL